MAVGLVEHEVPVKVRHRHRASKIRVCDLGEYVGNFVVNEAGAVTGKKDLRAIVCNGHRPRARHIAKKLRRGGKAGQLEHLLARHNVEIAAVGLVRPQRPDGAGADCL